MSKVLQTATFLSILFASCRVASAGSVIVDQETRKEYLSKAQVWWPEKEDDILDKDLFNGPKNPYDLKTFQTIDCDFVEPSTEDPLGGTTPKFKCEYKDKDGDKVELKIKYDQQYNPVYKWGNANPEVYSSVIGQRLLWSLGFATDQSVVLTVNCHNCPIEPWTYIQQIQGYDSEDVLSGWMSMDLINKGIWNQKADVITFNSTIAYIKLDKYHDGDEIDYTDDEGNIQTGYGWKEMYENPTSDAEQQTARDALSIFAAFLSYCDNFDGNQGFICLDDDNSKNKKEVAASKDKSECDGTPFIYIHDFGGTLGYGWNLVHKNFWPNYVDLKQWLEVEMWGDVKQCEVYVNGIPGCSWRGNLPVTEAGRAMAARLLSKLSDEQIHDLFTGARVDLMRNDSISSWVDGFKKKMTAGIFNTVCKA